jgi:hypothetical protein
MLRSAFKCALPQAIHHCRVAYDGALRQPMITSRLTDLVRRMAVVVTLRAHVVVIHPNKSLRTN